MPKPCSNCGVPLPAKRRQRYCRSCKAAYAREWRKFQPTRRQIIEALKPYGLTIAYGTVADIVKRETKKAATP